MIDAEVVEVRHDPASPFALWSVSYWDADHQEWSHECMEFSEEFAKATAAGLIDNVAITHTLIHKLNFPAI